MVFWKCCRRRTTNDDVVVAEIEDGDDPVVRSPDASVQHHVMRLYADGIVEDGSLIRKSDYNLMRRYELHSEEEEVEYVHAQVVLRHAAGKYLDLYYYEKERMNEVRYVVSYHSLHSMSFDMNHNKLMSTLILRFDVDKEVTLPNCPIEVAIYLSDVLFH